MQGFYLLVAISAWAIVRIYAESEPYTPEVALREKNVFCRELKEHQAKLPAKYQAPLNHAQSVLCKDSTVSTSDIVDYLDNSFTPHEQTEIRILLIGKGKYCKFFLGLHEIWAANEERPKNPSEITTPEYVELNQACSDSTKDVRAILPLAINFLQFITTFTQI